MTDVVARLGAALSDRYVIERELGAGGMATVYLAHDVRHDRKVALKVLRPELSAILGGERFLTEIKTTANLQHPHILGLFDSGEADGTVFYVMPYVDGESLRDRLTREKQLPVDEAVRIAKEVADALHYAHGHGIVHRDIKPENILLHGGHAMVADFGIALAASKSDGATRMTETGMSLGTPHYMSPEQAMGEREITPRADIYALGCVLYEMLTAEPPFTGATAQAIIARVMTEEPRSLTLQRRTIPPHVEAVVRRALEKLPADRFATARDFAVALDDVSFATTGGAGHPSAGRSVRRSAAFVPWLVAGAATVAAAAGWLTRGAPRRDDAPVRFYHIPDSGHSVTSVCCGAPIAISPDGRTIAYEGVQQRVAIWVRELDQLAARHLAGTEGARGLFFSPDGRWIGFTNTAGTSIMKVAVDGGAPVTVAEVGSFIAGATWTEDNQIIFARVDSAGLFSVTADGGQPRRLVTPDTAGGPMQFAWPSYVLGANAVLFAVSPRGAAASARVGYLKLGAAAPRLVGLGGNPQYANGHLVTLRDGQILVAQRFDPATGDTTGPAVRIAEGVIVRAGALGEWALSPGGTLVHQVGNSFADISLLRPDGNAARIPMHLAQVSHFDNPRLSPDGRQVLFAGYHDQEARHIGYVVDVIRGSAMRVTFGGNTEYLAWTPDGRRVVYRKGDTLATRRSDRSGEEQVLLRPSDRVRPSGRVATGGEWLVFSAAPRGSTQSDIWMMRHDGSDSARPFLATPFHETGAALSSDGRLIAFVSDETGRPEVYVSAFPAGGSRTAVSIEGGREPVWSRDGRTLHYRNEMGEIVAARLRRAGGELVVDSRTTALRASLEGSPDGAEYDVDSRTGRFVAFNSQSGGGRIVVTINAVRRP